MSGDVITLCAADGSNGPIPKGTLCVVVSGPACLGEVRTLREAGEHERADAAEKRARAPAMRGHPSRAVTVTTASGWGVFDLADLAAAPDPKANEAAEAAILGALDPDEPTSP